MDDPRTHSDFAVKWLPKWDTLKESEKLYVCARISAEIALKYPQVDKNSFNLLQAKCYMFREEQAKLNESLNRMYSKRDKKIYWPLLMAILVLIVGIVAVMLWLSSLDS